MEVYEANSYVEYVENCLKEGHQRAPRGKLSKLALSLQCHPTFIRQVISRKANFSNEQSLMFCDYYNLKDDETEYFLDLVNRDRAGTESLKKLYSKRLDRLKSKNNDVSNRLNSSVLKDRKSKELYFGSWLLQVVHCLSQIEEFQDNIPEKLNQFGIERKDVFNAMDMLIQLNLATLENKLFKSTNNFIHLPKNDMCEKLFHSTWRNYSLNNLMRSPAANEDSLCFTSLLTLSKVTSRKVLKRLLDLLSELNDEISDSPSEEVFLLGIDYHQVIK